MRRSFLLLVSLSIFGFGIAAHAGTITAGVYNLNNASINGYSVTGTVTLNSAGNATATDLTFNNPNFNNPGIPYFNTVTMTNVYNGLSQNYFTTANNAGQIAFYFNTISDANGYFNLCIGNAQCGTSAGKQNPSTLQIYGFYNSATGSNPGLATTNFSSGYLTEAAKGPASVVTPEPASLFLLGTGIIGLAGMSRFLKS